MSDAIQHVIVPVDGSRHSRAAVGYAALLAGRASARLHLLHVFPSSPDIPVGPSWAMNDLVNTDLVDEQRFARLREKSAENAFAAARKQLDKDISAEEAILDGDPAKVIADYAGKLPDCMIIMGARGLGQVGQMLLGSVSHRVLHQAPCPVTIVKHT